MGMYETADTNTFESHAGWDCVDGEQVDWAASCRLALVVSILAAAIALLLSTVVNETALVVAVIVAATATSWFHLEHGQLTRPTRRPLPLRHD
jgi:LPS O-antigen subunit length determinant protein (WzzB/FepE family)